MSVVVAILMAIGSLAFGEETHTDPTPQTENAIIIDDTLTV